jgi:hypothetical protein
MQDNHGPEWYKYVITSKSGRIVAGEPRVQYHSPDSSPNLRPQAETEDDSRSEWALYKYLRNRVGDKFEANCCCFCCQNIEVEGISGHVAMHLSSISFMSLRGLDINTDETQGSLEGSLENTVDSSIIYRSYDGTVSWPVTADGEHRSGLESEPTSTRQDFDPLSTRYSQRAEFNHFVRYQKSSNKDESMDALLEWRAGAEQALALNAVTSDTGVLSIVDDDMESEPEIQKNLEESRGDLGEGSLGMEPPSIRSPDIKSHAAALEHIPPPTGRLSESSQSAILDYG